MTSSQKDTHYIRLGCKLKRPHRKRKPIVRIYVRSATIYMSRPYSPTQRLFQIPELVGLLNSFKCKECENVLQSRCKYHTEELDHYRVGRRLLCEECAEKMGMGSCEGCFWYYCQSHDNHCEVGSYYELLPLTFALCREDKEFICPEAEVSRGKLRDHWLEVGMEEPMASDSRWPVFCSKCWRNRVELHRLQMDAEIARENYQHWRQGDPPDYRAYYD